MIFVLNSLYGPSPIARSLFLIIVRNEVVVADHLLFYSICAVILNIL